MEGQGGNGLPLGKLGPTFSRPSLEKMAAILSQPNFYLKNQLLH